MTRGAELTAESDLRLEEIVLRGAFGDAEDAADLAMREALDLGQDENRPPTRVELAQSVLQDDAKGMVVMRCRDQSLRLLCLLLFLASIPAPSLVEARVHQDPIQPGKRSGVALGTAPRPEGLQECLLHRVFRIGVIPQKVAGNALEPRTMGGIELVESREDVPSSGAAQVVIVERPSLFRALDDGTGGNVARVLEKPPAAMGSCASRFARKVTTGEPSFLA
jgi:hypothetical protein